MNAEHAAAVGASIAGAYLVGAIPFGLLLGKARGVDIRDHGSGNIGATNVMRVLGKRLGALCFVLDTAKGALPTLAGGAVIGALGHRDPDPALAAAWLAIACATIAGHMFPVWLRFKGGKGVATGLGAMLAVWPHLTIPALLAAAVWGASLRATRFVGVSSCIAGLSVPVWVCVALLARNDWAPGVILDQWPFPVFTGALAALVVWRHRANIARTLAGTEPRVGEPKRAQASEN